MRSNIIIAYLNVRSLASKVRDVECLLENRNIDVLCIGETWLSASVEDRVVFIEGYSFIRGDRGTRGGGVGLYVRSSFRYKRINLESDIEQLWLSLDANGSSVVVGVAYRPPALDCGLFLDELENAVVHCLQYSSGDRVVFGGDFNINLLQMQRPAAKQFCDMLEGFGGRQLIDAPTRLTLTSCSLLDVIVTLDADMVGDSGVQSCDLSDHDLTYCILDLKRETAEPIFTQNRDFVNIDIDLFYADLCAVDFQRVFGLQSVEDKLRWFNSALLALFDLHAPIKKYRFTKPYMPWVTDVIKIMMKLRDKAKQRFRRTNNAAHWVYYKALRNLTTASLRNEKKAYFRSLEGSRNHKKLWKDIAGLGLSKGKRIDLPPGLGDVNTINDYFVSVTNALARPVDASGYARVLYDDTFEFSTVDSSTVLKIVTSIKSNAVGSDGITINMLKMCLPHIAPYLTHIVNSCIIDNCIPNIWKEAIVLPLPKIKDPAGLGDLRPISVLPAMSKVLETVLRSQLSEYVESRNIIPNVQSGFRSGYSCTTALAALTDDIIAATDSNQITALVLLDFTKAFDTVNHDLLLSIFRYIGLGLGAVSLIRDYFHGRSQRVRVADRVSGSVDVKSGVAQGSILGPLMYCVYTAFFWDKIKNSKMLVYADDTQLYCSFPVNDYVRASEQLNSDLRLIREVSLNHSLHLNPEKSSVIVFGSRNACTELQHKIKIVVGDRELPVVTKCKVLGLVLDNSFRYREQVNKYIKNAYFHLKRIYPHRHSLSIGLKRQLCEAFVLAQFNYAVPVYHPAIDVLTAKRIQKVQNTCLRLIYGIRWNERISYKLVEARWLSMHNRRELHSLAFYHRVVTSGSPKYLHDKINYRFQIHDRDTRRNRDIDPPRHRSSLFERCFSYHVYKSYNEVPLDLRGLGISSFKLMCFRAAFDRQCAQLRIQ